MKWSIELVFVIVVLFLMPIRGSAQSSGVSISGNILDKESSEVLAFMNVVLSSASDSAFVTGTISNEEGLFILENISPGSYVLQVSGLGYVTYSQGVFVGDNSSFLDVGKIMLNASALEMEEISITEKLEDVSSKMDKKTYTIEDNLSQQGGSVLQSMKNLPGVTIEDGKVFLRGNGNVIILIDGKQSALTGFGNQSGLENLPASAIERIEIINNPSAKYQANGSGGIINIVLKKVEENGLNGKVGLAGGLGALWIKRASFPGIRPQYVFTPKINPSLSLNYRKKGVNVFLQADYLYTETLNKNEFVSRVYDDGSVIDQQTVRNRNTGFLSSKMGMDWQIDGKNLLSVYGLYGTEDIIDNGDEVFFNGDFDSRLRLWRFIEDELKTTIVGSAKFLHKFKEAGHEVLFSSNYTFHRENEQYFFENIYPSYTGLDSFKLISDEQVFDFNVDYVKPLRYGKFETGVKFRVRGIPTNMRFIPGLNSEIDSAAGGWANYQELIPAVYGNYVFQNERFDAEIGLRVEYVDVKYLVNPDHPTYESDGYDYIQPFPNLRFGYKLNGVNIISIAYNRRVNRPNEVDIRIFPKYDDAEIIKVGNPELKPQFTDKLELGYKRSFKKGYFYSALYGQMTNARITRIAASVSGSTLIYNIFQNAGKAYNAGMELIFSKELTKWLSINLNSNVYYNQIDQFSVINKYPVTEGITVAAQFAYSGNAKVNTIFHLGEQLDVQFSAIYLAADIIPQGKIGERFSLDVGMQKVFKNKKGSVFLNATDILNTMVIRKQIRGKGFNYTSNNYYETQVMRLGYKYRF